MCRTSTGTQRRTAELLQRLYGPRGGRFDPSQPLFFAEFAAGQEPETPAPTAAAEPKPSPRRARQNGRRRLPHNLPRQPKHHELTEAERLCQNCGQLRLDIGVDKSEQLDYRPASLFVIEHFVHKYVCPRCRRPPTTAAEPQAAVRPESMPMSAPEPEPQPAPPVAAALPPSAATDKNPQPSASGSEPTDILHALCSLYLAAYALGGAEAERWSRYVRWLRACWHGQVGEVLEELAKVWERLGPPAEDEEVEERDPRRVVREALVYLRNNRGRMDYPRYRRAGLPVTSSLVESLVGEFNTRVKGPQKYWQRPAGAEPILQVRAAVLSEDDRLARHFAQRPGNPYRRRKAG